MVEIIPLMKNLIEVKDSLDLKLGKLKPQFWEVFGKFITTKTSRKEWDSLKGLNFKKNNFFRINTQ